MYYEDPELNDDRQYAQNNLDNNGRNIFDDDEDNHTEKLDDCVLAQINGCIPVCPKCAGNDIRTYRDHLCCYMCGEYFKP